MFAGYYHDELVAQLQHKEIDKQGGVRANNGKKGAFGSEMNMNMQLNDGGQPNLHVSNNFYIGVDN